MPENKGKKTAALNYNVKYKKKLVPGMRVDIEANLKSYRRGIAIGSAVGYVDGEVAVSADFLIGIPDVLNQYKPTGGGKSVVVDYPLFARPSYRLAA